MIDNLVRRRRDREIIAQFTHTDLIALRVQATLARAGIGVPDEVSLLSYNDLRTGELPVPISAIAPQRAWVGRVACEVLVERLRSRGERTHTVRPPQRISLAHRSSTCAEPPARRRAHTTARSPPAASPADPAPVMARSLLKSSVTARYNVAPPDAKRNRDTPRLDCLTGDLPPPEIEVTSSAR